MQRSENRLININELSLRLSIAKGMLYNRVNQGRLPFKKIGRRVRFDWGKSKRSCSGDLQSIRPATGGRAPRIREAGRDNACRSGAAVYGLREDQ